MSEVMDNRAWGCNVWLVTSLSDQNTDRLVTGWEGRREGGWRV